MPGKKRLAIWQWKTIPIYINIYIYIFIYQYKSIFYIILYAYLQNLSDSSGLPEAASR